MGTCVPFSTRLWSSYKAGGEVYDEIQDQNPSTQPSFFLPPSRHLPLLNQNSNIGFLHLSTCYDVPVCARNTKKWRVFIYRRQPSVAHVLRCVLHRVQVMTRYAHLSLESNVARTPFTVSCARIMMAIVVNNSTMIMLSISKWLIKTQIN